MQMCRRRAETTDQAGCVCEKERLWDRDPRWPHLLTRSLGVHRAKTRAAERRRRSRSWRTAALAKNLQGAVRIRIDKFGPAVVEGFRHSLPRMNIMLPA